MGRRGEIREASDHDAVDRLVDAAFGVEAAYQRGTSEALDSEERRLEKAVRAVRDRLETAEEALREIAEVEPGKLAAARMEARANRALEELVEETHADRR